MEKTAKNTFVGGHARFEGRGAPGDKNLYNLFCRHRRFEYFLSNNFFKKNNIFQNINKNFFGDVTIFEGTGGRTTKMNVTFFFGKCGTKYSFQVFFSKNPIPSDLNPINWFWGHIFPHICGSIGPIVSKNNRVHP